MSTFETHAVTNQPTPFENVNLFASDRALTEATIRNGAEWALQDLTAVGEVYGRSSTLEAGYLANRHEPELVLFNRYGERRDEVRFHPAWHDLMTLAVRHGLHTSPWADPRPGAHVRRAAAFFMHGQAENGSQCPMAMTYGSVPAIRRSAKLTAEVLPALLTREYDPHFAPIADKRGALIGMGMTEKQGGSDVRANSTTATPVGSGGADQEYVIRGHKWFFSAPMCDGFLVLAQAPGGLSCFFLPRWLPDGTLNGLRIQRLKDKVGNRSNASSEVEFHDASAWLIGEEGRGVPIIIEMATYTRLDCGLGTAGMMRMALAQALHHASERKAFGKVLHDWPLMQSVLVDLALESEGATASVMRAARAFDQQDDEHESALRRILAPALKYYVCKRGPVMAFEAMEVLGGNGYTEEGPLARIYREMPLSSIWEGSGNVMCLDVLRAAQREPESVEALWTELAKSRGSNAHYDAHLEGLRSAWSTGDDLQRHARRLVEAIALAVQANELIQGAPSFVSDAFCAARLAGQHGLNLGVVPAGLDPAPILERARPQRS